MIKVTNKNSITSSLFQYVFIFIKPCQKGFLFTQILSPPPLIFRSILYFCGGMKIIAYRILFYEQG
jgi:hypothetical protein